MDTNECCKREALLAEAFVRLADSVVEEFDVIELLDELARHCVDFLGVDAAGLLLADRQDRLSVVAATTEQSHLAELFDIQATEGPGLDCYRLRQQVLVPDLGEESVARRWPRFVEGARTRGFQAVHSLPLRLRATPIGALTLFATTPTTLAPFDLRVGQAMADTATIAILQERSIVDYNQVTEQLQRALTSRLVIEQARTRLAERRGILLDEAFQLMRNYARAHNLRLGEVASTISTGTDLAALVEFEAWADTSSGSGNEPVPAHRTTAEDRSGRRGSRRSGRGVGPHSERTSRLREPASKPD